MSGYAVTALFYDAMADEHHRLVNRRIADVLKGVDATHFPIVDIGAGTGLSTQALAAAFPGAEVLAVEPDSSMLPAIMARVWSDPDLRRRVSILPMPILDAPIPSVVSAATMSAAIVHFGPDERAKLWRLLADRLSPRGRAVIEIQCPGSEDATDALIGTAEVGRIVYEGWVSTERIDAARQLWRLKYVSLLNGVEVDRRYATFVCWVASAEQIIREAEAAGLSGEPTDNLVVLGKDI